MAVAIYFAWSDISASAANQSRKAKKPAETMIDFGWIRP